MAPAFVKRAHQRLSEARYLRRSAAYRRRWEERHGTTVKHGPFAGMKVSSELASVPTLAGTYELELRDVIEEWIAARPDVVVDIGCSYGYYAVGLARALPEATVYAFDIDPVAQDLCRRMAELNGVADRVVIEGECTHERLNALPADGVNVLIDCEGCELHVLDPAAAPVLRRWPVLVELHDFVNPDITSTITERFEPSHDVRVIDELPRTGDEVPELEDFAPADRTRALDERRPAAMRWAALEPRR